ncbi:hypothetical protein CBS101457_001448 [Exobasidium rhododendri]|nr:hypothetical protein CBS101457_001448 [Exobasidium rhododendri]
MTTSTTAVPSLASLTSLLENVVRRYESALEARSVNFYPSQLTIAPQKIAGSSKSSILPWTVRCVPALLDKAKEKSTKDDQQEAQKEESSNQQKNIDVFAPPYHSDLLVEELPQHTVLLNKYCVVPRHFLLVTKEFQPQTSPPSPDSLAIAYRILHAHQCKSMQASSEVGQSKELLAFYNCGKVSGASQPHQHIQFAELGGEDTVKVSGSNTTSPQCAIPIESLLECIAKDGSEEEHVHALPLPYQHFVCLLSRAPIDDDARLSDYLGMKLLSLLDALFKARISAEMLGGVSKDAPKRRSSPSWNLLMTTRAIHLIPRQEENFDGLKGLVKGEDGVDSMGVLSINALGYAGHLLVKSQGESEALHSYPGGFAEILRYTGVAPVEDVTTSAIS